MQNEEGRQKLKEVLKIWEEGSDISFYMFFCVLINNQRRTSSVYFSVINTGRNSDLSFSSALVINTKTCFLDSLRPWRSDCTQLYMSRIYFSSSQYKSAQARCLANGILSDIILQEIKPRNRLINPLTPKSAIWHKKSLRAQYWVILYQIWTPNRSWRDLHN